MSPEYVSIVKRHFGEKRTRVVVRLIELSICFSEKHVRHNVLRSINVLGTVGLQADSPLSRTDARSFWKQGFQNRPTYRV